MTILRLESTAEKQAEKATTQEQRTQEQKNAHTGHRRGHGKHTTHETTKHGSNKTMSRKRLAASGKPSTWFPLGDKYRSCIVFSFFSNNSSSYLDSTKVVSLLVTKLERMTGFNTSRIGY